MDFVEMFNASSTKVCSYNRKLISSGHSEKHTVTNARFSSVLYRLNSNADANGLLVTTVSSQYLFSIFFFILFATCQAPMICVYDAVCVFGVAFLKFCTVLSK